MNNLMIGIGVQLGSSAVAIVLAAILLRGFGLNFGGFLTAVVVFTIAQSLLAGLVAKLAGKYAPALAGAASLVSTWLALIVATLPFGGIRIHGFFTWIWAALIIWGVTALCAVLVPKFLLKQSAQ
ncbi:phage holin family protein [Arthrobacter sp. HY1533]|uniref:phage holin family protein n=1 Tax=Arthrobacter sp. HY1533 TaxID=2970919 RepID=UPI0022BA043F|nr:phage holin family protein [Arthrobacter sp. HY1533]